MRIGVLLIGFLVFSFAGCATRSGSVNSDEQAIRKLFDNWMKATKEGDLELAHQCIADDAVFIIPGHGEMNKTDFAKAAAGSKPEESPFEYELDSKIREIKVFGDYAYLWMQSSLVMTPKKGDGKSTKMAGHTLAVLKKVNGRWVSYRDINTLLPVQE